MMNETKGFTQVLTATVVGLALLVVLFAAIGSVQAAPSAIVTPVSSPNQRVSAAAVQYPVTFMSAKRVVGDGRGTTYALPAYGILDLQYVIDQGTAINTATLKLQNSCDGVNWVTQGTVVSAKATDGSDIIQLNTYCRYAAILADVTNTNPVTITVIGVAK